MISVGGDGLFSEVFTSLLNRTQSDNNINQNDFDATLIEPTKTIGIIPAGKIFLLKLLIDFYLDLLILKVQLMQLFIAQLVVMM